MRRLFVGSRGIFLLKRMMDSPNCAVRSSRSNGRPFGDASLSINVSFDNSGCSHHSNDPTGGVWFWSLVFGIFLGFGIWSLELPISVSGYRLVQIQDD